MDLYKKIGLSEQISGLLEVSTYSLIISSVALLLWFISKRILLSFFNKISRNTKSKFDDFLLKNKIPGTLSYFPPILLLYFSFTDILEVYPVILISIQVILEVLGAFIAIIFIRRVLNSIKDYLKTLTNFKDKPIDTKDFSLFAGTAWFFSNIRMNQKLDYLLRPVVVIL